VKKYYFNTANNEIKSRENAMEKNVNVTLELISEHCASAVYATAHVQS
jgi:hypothetical protein